MPTFSGRGDDRAIGERPVIGFEAVKASASDDAVDVEHRDPMTGSYRNVCAGHDPTARFLVVVGRLPGPACWFLLPLTQAHDRTEWSDTKHA